MAQFSDLNLHLIGHTIQLSGAIYSGEGKHYLCFFPEDQGTLADIELLPMSQDEWKQFLQQSDFQDIEGTVPGPDGELIKAIYRKSLRQIDKALSWRVFRRDLCMCRYCGNDKAPMTIDHIICWEDGGPTIESNLLTSCQHCNKIRGRLEYSEWLKHPFYIGMSKRLKPEVREANRAIVDRLSSIPRVKNPKTRK